MTTIAADSLKRKLKAFKKKIPVYTLEAACLLWNKPIQTLWIDEAGMVDWLQLVPLFKWGINAIRLYGDSN